MAAATDSASAKALNSALNPIPRVPFLLLLLDLGEFGKPAEQYTQDQKQLAGQVELSDLILHPQGTVAQRISSVGESAVCTSIVVPAELRFGAEKAGSSKLAERIDLILSAVDILPLEEPADRHYGEVRQQLASQGTPIGPNDLLIAAQALALGLTVVTANVDEFSRVPGLGVENWLSE